MSPLSFKTSVIVCAECNYYTVVWELHKIIAYVMILSCNQHSVYIVSVFYWTSN